MPPKITYGKRTTRKQDTSFSKFFSPDKNAQPASKQTKRAASKPTEKDAAEAIDASMKQLRLCDEEKAPVGTEKEMVQPKKRRGRKPKQAAVDEAMLGKEKCTDIKSKTEERNKDTMKEIGERLEALDFQELETEAPKKRPRQRKPLRQRDANECATLQITSNSCRQNLQTKRLQSQAHMQEAPSTPTEKSRPAQDSRKTHAFDNKELLHSRFESPTEDWCLYSAYVSPLLSFCYGRKIVPFAQWSTELQPHFEVIKIAEASFSEVYRLSAKSSTGSVGESVLKLVALKTPPDAPLPCQQQERTVRNPAQQARKEQESRDEADQWKSSVDDVLSEVKLLQNLNHIPGFTNFREITVLQGRPSITFGNAWKIWNRSRPRDKKSYFPDPNKKTSYDDNQLWAVIEMQDAGTDCEKVMDVGGMSTVWEVWDIFWGVCLSVAKAEETCKFEHRDLHLENICIRSPQDVGDVANPVIKEPLKRKLGFTRLETTVIDYTLSRADIVPSLSGVSPVSSPSGPSDEVGSTSDPNEKPDVAYLDLNKDPSLFTGDAEVEYQYEIYRYMRGSVFHGNPLDNSPLSIAPVSPNATAIPPGKNTHVLLDTPTTSTTPETPRRSPRKKKSALFPCPPMENIWKSFHPKTNLLWAHFVLHKLLEHLGKHGSNPAHLTSQQIMRNVKGANEATADANKVKKKAVRLWKVLERVAALLEPKVLGHEGCLGSVKELVVLALEERWLSVGDVVG